MGKRNSLLPNKSLFKNLSISVIAKITIKMLKVIVKYFNNNF